MTTRITADNIESKTGSGSVVLATSPTLVTPALGAASATSLSIQDLITLNETTEGLVSLTGATGTVTHNLATTNIFVHTSVAANFTVNFTNVPTTNDRVISPSLIVIQGATAYLPNALQIDGVAQTIKWSSGSAPSATASRTEIFTFTLIRISSGWTVLGGLLGSYA